MEEDDILKLKTYFKIGVFSNGELIDDAKVTFVGPM